MADQTEHKTWLSLSQAAKLIGVHATTLRHWADQGHIHCFRTAGGHRRFRYDDIVAVLRDGMKDTETAHFLSKEQPDETTSTAKQATATAKQATATATNQIMQQALGHTRGKIETRGPHLAHWYYAFDEAGRERKRQEGRQLFALSIQYVLKANSREEIIQRGRQLGQLYGQESVRYRISLVDTVRAFNFFRRSLLDTLETRGTPDHPPDRADVQIGDVLDDFLSEVLYAVIDAYEVALLHSEP